MNDNPNFMDSTFVRKYWDARIFGNTFLEDGGNKEYIKTGAVQFGSWSTVFTACPFM